LFSLTIKIAIFIAYTSTALKSIRNIILYIISLFIASVLLRYTYRNISFRELYSQIQGLKWHWIGLSMLLGLSSHLIRAYRWKLLLQPLGFNLNLLRTFSALMTGYLSNLFVPRLGEIVRCSVLRRTTIPIPMGILLGTVGLERIIDFVGFLVVIVFTFLISFSEIKLALQSITFPSVNYKMMSWMLIGAIAVLSWGGVIIYRTFEHDYKDKLLAKARSFLINIKKGFYSIQRSKEKKLIVYTTIIKWGLYYLSDYVGLFAIHTTSHLDWKTGLAILTMTSLSFAVPIQGAIGAYHMLVSSILMAYGISQSNALLYAGVMHAMHMLTILICGGMSLFFNRSWAKQKKLGL
jgi:uncharacterized protein (TIRG00374 family)